ncbi:hypothetical protein GCM10022216_31320 [Sphingobacterium kyonggiense]|uniref:SnoaL-like domain-containing protein n=1 Tax=Sphingobacterium kyonggiense TaxID=714075 RepID=A0ABP7Z471_9SPHI
MSKREEIVRNYIQAYNNFDVEGMVAHFSDNIVFENILNGQTTDTLEGIEDFKEQAETAKSYFEDREQTITELIELRDNIEIRIQYTATLAIDFPNGLNKGEKLELAGKSIFQFNDDDQVVRLLDIA